MDKVYLLSLGCARNLIDSEVLLGLFEEKGFSITQDPEACDIAVVNTCAFIQDAKQESINIILQLCDLKKKGKIKKLVIAGCLSQRYAALLMDEIGEIDGLFGTSDFIKIPDMCKELLAGEKVRKVKSKPDFLYNHSYRRKLLTPSHYAYVKIQEGCSNKCSYCIIPDLKGPRRSRDIKSVLKEIERLKDMEDVKEIILIGQDTTSFGMDRSRAPELAKLLREIIPLMENRWIRLLYTHPAHFTDELIEVMGSAGNICEYVDLPLQHINDRILAKMNRGVTRKLIESLIKKIRKKINDVVIRTSVIVGFPGESDKEFMELMAFLEDIKFERLGAFIYSPEENTRAVHFKGQIPDKVKKERFDRVMRLQQKISAAHNLKMLNKEIETLIDEKDPSDSGQFAGRSRMDAPEVDGVVYVKGRNLKCGGFVKVKITDTAEYDLTGEVV